MKLTTKQLDALSDAHRMVRDLKQEFQGEVVDVSTSGVQLSAETFIETFGEEDYTLEIGDEEYIGKIWGNLSTEYRNVRFVSAFTLDEDLPSPVRECVRRFKSEHPV